MEISGPTMTVTSKPQTSTRFLGESHCLSQHYSGSPVRSPARAALLTGRFWQWNEYQPVGATNAAMLEGDSKVVRPRMDIRYASPNDEEDHKL